MALGTAVALVASAAPASASASSTALALVPAQPQQSAPAAQSAAPGASARAPLSCAGNIMLSAGTPTTQLYQGVTSPGEITFMPVGTASQDYNAIGVNPNDNYIYAIQRGSNPNLLRVDDAGGVTILGATGLPSLSGGSSYAAGAFDDAGAFYVAYGYDNLLYRVDVTAMTATPITLSETLGGVIDFAYSEGYLWGANRQGGISRIDPTTGTVTTYPSILPVADYGGTYTYGNGDLGFFSNAGTITRIRLNDPENPTFTQLSSQQAPANSSSVDATSCFQMPVDLAVTKEGPASVSAGGEVSYTIRLTNNGPNPSSGWTLTDDIPAGLENAATTTDGCSITNNMLSCTGGALAVDDSVEITLTGTAAVDATSIENTAKVFGNDPDPDPDNNVDTTTTTVAPSVDLGVTKTGPATAIAGEDVSYTITVTNNGPSNSTGWTVTDEIPATLRNAATTTPGCSVTGQTLTCEGGALAVGDSATVTLTGTAAANATRIVNPVTVEGNEPDPNPDNNEDTVTTTLERRVDLAVTKAGPATVAAGGDVSYTITVTNNGPSDSTGWGLNDPIPAGLENAATTTPGCSVGADGLTCIGGPLAVGDSTEITLTGTAAPDATSIVNTAVVDGNEPDPNPDNDEDTTTTTVNPSVDLAVAKVGPAEVTAGGRVLYRITVTNNGPSDSTGWTLTDTIPLALRDAATPTDGCAVSGRTLTCTGGALAVGDSTSVLLTGTAPSEAGTFVNTATVEGNEPDPDPDNNEDTVTTVVPPVVNAEVDLTLAKEGPATVKEGEEISYTITVTNNGPGDSSGWTLSDTVPGGLENAATSTDGCAITGRTLTCEGGPLADGESADVVLTGTAAEDVTSIVNTAVVEGNEPDPDPDNNDDTTTTEVTGEPGLTIEKKQNGPATVKPGDTVEYTVTVTNTGDTAYTAANPAVFTDDLSDLLDDAAYNDDAEASRGTVSYDEPTLSWRGALEPGQSATITFSITTDVRTFGDLKLYNTVVSDTPGNNCARGSEDERCTTDGKVTPKDKK